jgi:uncharacterized membrane protein
MSERPIRRELKTGLAETRGYLLSHHEPAEYHRCHSPSIGGRTVHICARCSGIYPGIVAGFVLFATGTATGYHLPLIALFPVFAIVDWAVTTFTSVRGWNSVRTVTGALLGTAYGLGLCHLLIAGRLSVLAVGVVYGGLAAISLWSADRL